MKNWANNKIKLAMPPALIIILCAFLLGAGASVFPICRQPEAANGVLDLSQWDFDEDGTVQLAGRWAFYWNQLLTEDNFSAANSVPRFDGFQKVPGVWNQYDIKGKTPGGTGYATYRLSVKTTAGGKALGLKIRTMSTAYRIYIDGTLVASAGTVGRSADTSAPQYLPQTVSFTPASNEFEIIVQVTNFVYSRGGIWRSITLGTDRQIRALSNRIARMESFCFSALLIMACYHLLLYRTRKENKDMGYIAVAMLVTAVRILVTGQYYITALIPSIPFSAIIYIEYLTVFWNLYFWLLFACNLYPDEFSRSFLRYFKYGCFLLTILISFTPVRVYTGYVLYLQAFQALMFLYYCAGAIAAVRRKRDGAAIMLISLALTIVNFTVNYLSLSFFIYEEIEAMIITMVAALFLQTYILTRRYNRAFDSAREYSRQMERLNGIKDELIADVTQELRTPLNGIISITESTLRGAGRDLPDATKSSLGAALEMEHGLARMIGGAADLLRIKDGRLYLEKNTFEMSALIDNMLAEAAPDMEKKKVDAAKEYQPGLELITADKYRVAQVVYNLLENAVKATPPGGRVTVNVYSDKQNMYVSVADGGIGPSDNIFDRLLENPAAPKVNENNEHEEPRLGLGISLAIARAHGGDIRILNGECARYILSLPIKGEFIKNYLESQIPASAEDSSGACRQLCMEGTGAGTIVVLDDQYGSLFGLSAILNAEGYTVKGFTDAKEGIADIFSHRDADIVIADMIMPHMPGYCICQEIRSNFSLFELPILLLSARREGDGTILSLEAGANDVLLKPFEREELLTRINTLRQLKNTAEQAIQNEVSMLQAQINPHFLHNTLNALAAACYENPKAYEAIVMLSDYFRCSFSLSPNTKEIPLSREIELVRAYLSVEKLRFGPRLLYEIRCEDTDGVILPPFLIQPLVENAVRHGITKREQGGKVTVTGRRVENVYEISVEDDGIGIPPETVKLVLSGKRSGEMGIGLGNVRQRLIKRCHSELHIESAVESGTRISFIVPVKEGTM